MNKKILFYVIPAAILVMGFLIMQLLAGLREDPVRSTPSVVAKNVWAIVVEMTETQTIVEGLGKLASSQPVQLVSEAAGTMHRGDVPFMPGQHFRNGQVLLRIDDRQQVYNLNSTKSDFLNALATVLPEVKVDFPNTYEVWQSYFDRCTFDRPLEPLPETSERKIKLLLTRFNVYKLFFAVKNLEVALENT